MVDAVPEEAPILRVDFYLIDGFPFAPPTGDILYRRNGEFGIIELKFARLFPQEQTLRTERGTTKMDRGPKRWEFQLTAGDLTLVQLEFLEKGLMTLVFIGEFMDKVEGLEILKEKKIKLNVERDIQKFHDLFGQDKINYSYLIINQKNYSNYDGYIKSLKPTPIKRAGRVIAYKISLRFGRMWNEFTPPEQRYQAVRSRICSEIVKQVFGV